MSKQISAGIIIYQKTKQGILFLLLYHGGEYWNFPKGKIEENKEEPREAAFREVREETGLTKKNLRFHLDFKVENNYEFEQDGTKVSKKVIYFLAKSNEVVVKINPREHRGYAWFNYNKAERVLRYKNLKENLNKAYKAIKNKTPQITRGD